MLRNDGTLWLNLGDSYAGVGEPKDMLARCLGAQLVQPGRSQQCRTRNPMLAQFGKRASNRKTLSAFRGGSLSLCRRMVGISDKTLFGRSRILCRKASPTVARSHTNTFSYFRNRLITILIRSLSLSMQPQHACSAFTKRAGSDRQFTSSGQDERKHESHRAKVRFRQCEKQKQRKL